MSFSQISRRLSRIEKMQRNQIIEAKKPNGKLRLYAKDRGVRLWEIAEKFNISETAFSKKLRKELSEEDAKLFKQYVDELAKDTWRQMERLNKATNLL